MASDRLTFVLLHGALLAAPSMAPIGQALLKAFPGAAVLPLELPGHGQRRAEVEGDFGLGGLAKDIRAQIDSRASDLDWQRTVLVGESTGALVFAEMAPDLPQAPLALLLGEPPLNNGPALRQVKAGLEQAGTPTAKALWSQTFAFDRIGTLDFIPRLHRLGDLPCPTLLAYGLERDAAQVPVPSVVDPAALAALEGLESLIACGVSGRGHRVLQSLAPHWASMLKGVLAARQLGGQRSSQLKP